ncbi:golgi uridine diphosphate-N- acetylglucosamine transporter [Sorochytrium milnesiophthora]
MPLSSADFWAVGPLIFGGCCFNAIVLESLTRAAPSSTMLITLAQFIFVSVVGLREQVDVVAVKDRPRQPSMSLGKSSARRLQQHASHFSPSSSSGSESPAPKRAKHVSRYVFKVRGYEVRIRRSKVPFKQYMVMVMLFLAVSVLNNVALSYRVPMPVHIIFRSGGLLVSLAMGVLLLKRRYSTAQYMGVVLVTIGVIVSTWASHAPSSSQAAAATGSTPQRVSDYTFGIVLLCLALVLSGLLGVYQEITYSRYGRYWRENLFYTHFYALPFFLFFRHDLMRDMVQYNQSPHFAQACTADSGTCHVFGSVATLLPIPDMWAKLIINTLTQYACIAGVHKLSAVTTSLTLNLVLTLRKFVSLSLSFLLFNNPFTAVHVLASASVFCGSIMYAWASTRGGVEHERMPAPMRAMLRRSVAARLQQERVRIKQASDMAARWRIIDDDCNEEWTAVILGPAATPYQGGHFRVHLAFGDYYPLKPPLVTMLTRIHHPNINSRGAICLDILRDHAWSATDTLVDVLNGIELLLRYPNADDFLVERAARQLQQDPSEFVAEARRVTEQHAMASVS